MRAIRSLGRGNRFSVSATEKTNASLKRLRPFDPVVFLNTTGDVLGPRQQKAFKGYIRHGGGWVGIHSAADTEYDWPFHGEAARA